MGPTRSCSARTPIPLLSETVDNGYPVLEHVKKLVKDEIIWAPAIDGAFVLTKRGGDFDLHIGRTSRSAI